MPTYDYQCAAGHSFEKIHKMSETPRVKCPTCGKPAVRQISGGAGLVFKGSGFYITDYGKDGKGARKAEATESTAPAAKSEGGAAGSAAAPAVKAEPTATKEPAKKSSSGAKKRSE